MGSLKKAFSGLVTAMTLGTVDLNKQKAASLGKAQAAAAAQASSLQKEKVDNSKKRVRLYATAGNENGEEVENVGISGNRGKLFS